MDSSRHQEHSLKSSKLGCYKLEQSDFDPCLLMKKGIICVVYVDDTFFLNKMEMSMKSKLPV